jgi:hypothetical protein
MGSIVCLLCALLDVGDFSSFVVCSRNHVVASGHSLRMTVKGRRYDDPTTDSINDRIWQHLLSYLEDTTIRV